MPVFKSLAELELFLKAKVNESLVYDVKEVVVDEFSKHIQEDVYNAYTPIEYTRRYENGGLGDENNIVSELIGEGKLATMNIAPPNKKNRVFNNLTDLSRFIQQGSPPLFGDVPPRPFVDNTAEDLKESGKVKQALKKGLSKRGIKTK